MLKTKMTKEDRAREKSFNDSFSRLANEVQFNIMDLSKMKSEAYEMAKGGFTMDEAMSVVVKKYRTN